MHIRCHRIDIIIEFPFSFSLIIPLGAIASIEIEEIEEKKGQTEADRRPSVHKHIQVNVCIDTMT